MKDLELSEFAAWAEERITLKHNWFDRLADVVRDTPDGAQLPAALSHWDTEYPHLEAWVGAATSALSPRQLLDLEAFNAWPAEFRAHYRKWLHERFQLAAPHVKQLADECKALLRSVDNELRPLLDKSGPALTADGREKIAKLLNTVAQHLRELPERVEWPEAQAGDLLNVLVIDDLLGRVTVQARGRPVVLDEAARELGEMRRSFCYRFHLLDGDCPERTAQMEQPIGRAFFCAGQRYDPEVGFVNDLELLKRCMQAQSGEWALVIADVLFNTGKPDEYGRGDGETRFGIDEVVPWLRQHAPDLSVVALTTESSQSLIKRTQELGVEYLHRTESSHADMLILIGRSGRATPAQLRRALNVPDDFIAEDPRAMEVLLEAWTAAHDPVGKTVLITGEPGTGKERLAKFIHDMSPRADQPLKFVNCARYSKELADTELFGYYASSFTGAGATDTPGVFHEANGGTLVLDEFGDLDKDVQAKLLRTLEPKRARDREIEPRGNRGRNSKLPTKVNVRIICSTNQPLHLVRSDLQTRVGRIIEIPPLSERLGDIVPLANYFLSHPERIGKPGVGLDQSACEFLTEIDLHGNARTLEQLLETAATGKGGRNIITRSDLEQAYERLRRSLSSTDSANAGDAATTYWPQGDERYNAAPRQADSHLSQAVANIIAAAAGGRDWNEMTKAELDSLDEALNGRLWEVIAVLVDWALFRAPDVPAIVQYITGQRMLRRTPEDFLRRLLKLEPRILQQIAASPYVSDNVRLRGIITACCDEWARRTRPL